MNYEGFSMNVDTLVFGIINSDTSTDTNRDLKLTKRNPVLTFTVRRVCWQRGGYKVIGLPAGREAHGGFSQKCPSTTRNSIAPFNAGLLEGCETKGGSQCPVR
jgi:hypothetical protein